MNNILQITFSNGFSVKKIAVIKISQQILAATKQLYEWFSQSVSLVLSCLVCHTFFTMFPSWYHHEIQEWLPMTEVMSMQKIKVRGQKWRLHRSKPKLAVSGP